MPTTYRRMSHFVFACDYHLVWPTKYRREILTPGVQTYLLDILKELPQYRPDLIVKEANTDVDHIHLLVSIPPTITVGSVVRLIKTNTARSLNEKFPHLREVYWGTRSIWSAGYFASTVGVNETLIRRYIQNQGKEDAGQNTVTLF
jgi:putative transposase